MAIGQWPLYATFYLALLAIWPWKYYYSGLETVGWCGLDLDAWALERGDRKRKARRQEADGGQALIMVSVSFSCLLVAGRHAVFMPFTRPCARLWASTCLLTPPHPYTLPPPVSAACPHLSPTRPCHFSPCLPATATCHHAFPICLGCCLPPAALPATACSFTHTTACLPASAASGAGGRRRRTGQEEGLTRKNFLPS